MTALRMTETQFRQLQGLLPCIPAGKTKRRKLTAPTRAQLTWQDGAWVLELSDATPSANQILRLHWRVQRRLKDEWATLVAGAVYRASPRLSGRATGPRLVTIERWSKRSLDHDNFVAGCKMAMDRLKDVGLIEDDRPGLVSVEYIQRRGEPSTRITVRQAT